MQKYKEEELKSVFRVALYFFACKNIFGISSLSGGAPVVLAKLQIRWTYLTTTRTLTAEQTCDFASGADFFQVKV
jgi:hypothetical protein